MPHDTIWKFQLALVQNQRVPLPSSSQPIAVAMQDGQLCLWAKVSSSLPLVAREIIIVGTGHPLPDVPHSHIGTVQDGPYVWHVFDGGDADVRR